MHPLTLFHRLPRKAGWSVAGMCKAIRSKANRSGEILLATKKAPKQVAFWHDHPCCN
jgi:hypothetical protein